MRSQKRLFPKRASLFIVFLFTFFGLSLKVFSHSSASPNERNLQVTQRVVNPQLTPSVGSLCSTAWMNISNYNSSYDAYLTLNTNSVLKSTNSATWTPNIPEAGLYRVEAFVANHPSLYWSCINQTISADTRDARYVIKHANGENRVSRDQLPLTNQWLDLGSYYFNAGQSGKVSLSDLNGEANSTHFISFSAMRFTLVEESNDVMPVLTPSPGSLCSTAWYNISSYNSFYDAYLTLNTNNSSYSTNYGVWTPSLSQTGLYKVEAFVANHPSLYWSCLGRTISPDTTDARYTITYAGGQTTKSMNQLPLANQWLDLGNYNFNAGTSGRVKLSDYNGESHASHFISFSAMRFSLLDTSGCVITSSSSSLAASSISALNSDSCEVLPEAKLIYPYEDEDRKPEDYPKYGPGDTIRIEAQASDPLGQGIERVEFWVQYDGDWHRIRDEYNPPYEADFTIPAGTKTQTIEIGIHVVSTDDRVVNDPGGKRYANYQENYNSGVTENWIPAGQRAYLNQHSMCLSNTDDGCTITGQGMCGSAAVSMALAMNYVTYSDYNSLVDTAKFFSEKAPMNDITVITPLLNQYYDVLASYGNNKKKVTEENAWNIIKSEIDQGYPVIVLSDRWRASNVNRTGHYIVVVGYQIINNNKILIVYDSGGEWVKKYNSNGTWYGYIDKNTSDPSSHKGQWVFYDYSDVWGFGSDNLGWLITIHPRNPDKAVIGNYNLLEASTSFPDIISDEEEILQPFDGFEVDYEAPNVQSIYRNSSEMTSEDSVSFTVTFSELVVDVDEIDFVLTTSGVVDADITNVSGTGNTYKVTVDTGLGNGTIRLDVVDNDSIVDGMANPLGGYGIGNGDYTDGEVYTIVSEIPPSNDDFNFAETISSFGPAEQITTLGATLADDDPAIIACEIGQGNATVWYKYTPDSDTAISLDTFSATYDTFIAVWTGERGNLELVACNDDANGTSQSSLAIQVKKDITYYIEIGQP